MAHRHMVGIVVSDRMKNTVVVQVSRLVRHPVYQKVMRRSKKFKAFNPGIDAKVGDEIRIEETRPLSKEVCWRVTEIVRKGAAVQKIDSEQMTPQSVAKS